VGVAIYMVTPMYKPLYLSKLALSGLLIFCLFSFSHGQESQSNAQSKETSRDLLRQQMEVQLQEQEKLLGMDDEDLGEQILVKRKPKAWNISFASDVGELWSSNVLQTETDTQADFAFTHNDSVTATYKLTEELSVSGSFRYSLFRYSRLIAQNFDAYNASGSFSYAMPYSFNFTGGLGWTTIYSMPIDDSVYEEVDFNGGISKIIPIEFNDWFKQHTAAFVGYTTDYRMASPKDLDKFETAPYVGFFCALSDKLNGQMIYRWNYSHYQIGGRKDYNNSITANVSWTPYHWLSASVFSSYTDNNSVGKSARNYSVNNTGVSAKLSWKFG